MYRKFDESILGRVAKLLFSKILSLSAITCSPVLFENPIVLRLSRFSLVRKFRFCRSIHEHSFLTAFQKVIQHDRFQAVHAEKPYIERWQQPQK
ncbi:unknown protein [Desulfotalea psychrophila LSv54]|uniref:Uncharacterized protein n=1 Tax=Desulfotalea psychrophila (strain LSv54 / DSM 12343) TaxID=177439 RepID=Q6AKG7_DESPS|nr:unknown protein [Desulfotalea psychrophila LSv54]